MLAISPPEKVEQLITIFSQRLRPPALQRLSVAEILQDASALAIMREEIPSMDRITKQQKPIFGRALKFLHLHEPTGYEKDEEHKRTAVRYLALRTMLQQCGDIKIASIQEACLDKVLRWFEATERNNFASARASTPILPPRMSPKKVSAPKPWALDKCPSEASFLPATTNVSSATVVAKLEKYKMPDLRASHIRRIAELRSRGADISESSLPPEETNNSSKYKPQKLEDQSRTVENRMIEATFKLYHPETDAEHEMNLMWIRRRQEEEKTRNKDLEVQQRVQQWAMERSRDESESLRKRESTKLVAGLGQMLQDGVDQEKPFSWQSTISLHPDLVGMSSQSNQSTVSTAALVNTSSAAKGAQQQVDVTARKLPSRVYVNTKQSTQIIIKSRKPTVSASGGMHFRNQLPPNYVPPKLVVTSSVPKSKREASVVLSTEPSSTRKDSSLKRSSTGISDELSSASEDEEDPAMDENAKTKRKSVKYEAKQQMKLQSFHVPFYFSDGTDQIAAGPKGPARPQPRGTIPVLPLPADPEFRRLQEANEMRRVFAIPSAKKPNLVIPSRIISETGREVSSSRQKSASKSRSGSKIAKAKRPTSTLPRTAPSYTFAELQCTASTSDLRHSQLEEVEKIRRLFEANNLSFSSQAFERGLLVPEDRPLLETISNLPFAGSRLSNNPLTKPKAPKTKKKPSSKKKKSKKGKKNSKAPKSSK